MTASFDFDSGKGHTDENFPVGSVLIAKRHRALVMAFYRVARMSDDVADHPTAPAEAKLARLDQIEATLLAKDDHVPEAMRLRVALAERGLDATHALDLRAAFRLDVTKTRYADWDDLMAYCRLSAAPVGRFVLDVHGERRDLWPMNDALCAALQVINHLQDCGKDRREIDRVYIPLDRLAAAGLTVEALDAAVASPALRGVIAQLARDTMALLDLSRPFAGGVRDARLALEIGVIQALAEDLCRGLMVRDPLSQTVHHGKARMGAIALGAMLRTSLSRLGRRR